MRIAAGRAAGIEVVPAGAVGPHGLPGAGAVAAGAAGVSPPVIERGGGAVVDAGDGEHADAVVVVEVVVINDKPTAVAGRTRAVGRDAGAAVAEDGVVFDVDVVGVA